MIGYECEHLPVAGFRLVRPSRLVIASRLPDHCGDASRVGRVLFSRGVEGADDDVLDVSVGGTERVFVVFVAAQQIIGVQAVCDRPANTVRVEYQARWGIVTGFVAAGHEEHQGLLLAVDETGQRAQRLRAAPQDRQKQGIVGPRLVENAAVLACKFVDSIALAPCPFAPPESDEYLDVPLEGPAVRLGEPQLIRLIDLAQKAADLLPRVGADPVLQIAIEILGQGDIGTDQKIGIVGLHDSLALIVVQVRPLERRDEGSQTLRRGAKILQRQPPPAHAAQVCAKSRGRRFVVGVTDETGVVGPGDAPGHLDFTAEALPALAESYASEQGKKGDMIAIVGGMPRGQDTPVVPLVAEQLPHPAPREKVVGLGIGRIDRFPVGLQRFECGKAVDDVQLHGLFHGTDSKRKKTEAALPGACARPIAPTGQGRPGTQSPGCCTFQCRPPDSQARTPSRKRLARALRAAIDPAREARSFA